MVSLEAVDNADLTAALTVEGPGMAFTFENAVANHDERKARYRSWLLAKGFQDLARGLRETLEAAYLWVGYVRLHGQPLPQGGFPALTADLVQTANGKNFPTLLAAVNEGLTEPLHWEDAFKSIQKVRNCLEHRAGMVNQKDAGTDQASLRLSIPRLQLFVQDGDQDTELVPNMVIERGGSLFLRHSIRELEYPVGTRISFSSDDFGEIAMACWMMATVLKSKLPRPPAPANVAQAEGN